MLKNKVNELSKEVKVMKKESTTNIGHMQSTIHSSRIQMTRSVSPRTAAEAQYILRGDKNKANMLNKTSTNLNTLKKLGSAREKEGFINSSVEN
jgi:hypothetical protein